VAFDAAALGAPGPLVLRARQPGDRLVPFGAGGHSRKVQDILVDAGVPRALRDRLPLLAAGPSGPLLWVPGPGGRRAAFAPITAATSVVVMFRFVKRET
jgi:tRNA(Ile)-lysidine synthase